MRRSRTPILFCIGVSDQDLAWNIREQLFHLQQSLLEEEEARESLAITTVTFDSNVCLFQEQANVDWMVIPPLQAGVPSALNHAIVYALKNIQEQIVCYAKAGEALENSLPPALVLITDAKATEVEDVSEAVSALHRAADSGRPEFLYLGFGDFDRGLAATLAESSGGFFALTPESFSLKEAVWSRFENPRTYSIDKPADHLDVFPSHTPFESDTRPFNAIDFFFEDESPAVSPPASDDCQPASGDSHVIAFNAQEWIDG